MISANSITARLATLIGVVAASSAAVAADATRIAVRPIVVAGNQNVEATSMNDHGVIVGNLHAGITDAVSAIEIAGQRVTTLPSPDPSGSVAHPKVIDDAGDILGWANNGIGDPTMFLLKNGAFKPRYRIIVDHDEGGHNFIVQPMGLVNRSMVFGTVIVSLTAPTAPFYGVPGQLVHVPLLNSFEHLNSLNTHGVVGGVSFTFDGEFKAFFGSGKTYTSLLPPGATQSQGGFVDDAGDVAGSWTDADNLQHGFVYRDGAYTMFDMPEAASAVAVTGINDAGRVVGTYTDTRRPGRQHAFLYNGGTVTVFGNYSPLDVVLVSINARGDMLVDRQLEYANYQSFLSYRASCSGPGC